jgi:uncharacterized repeat protein (TIGR03803 family)
MTGRVRERGLIAGMRQRPARTALAIAFLSLLVAIPQSLHAQTFSVLYTFTGKGGDNPPAGLVRDSAGNLYGTSASGSDGVGTVLKLSLGKDGAWKETVLYRFQSGLPPEGLLTLDSASNLYGTTTFGGGGGTVFKVTKGGKETLLYSFCSLANCADGSGPNGGMVRDAAGNLYGTTILGGNGGECCGTVFKLTKSGEETVLYNFCSVANCADGAFPIGGGETFPLQGLVRDAAGNLYGTTPNGGNAAFCGDDRGCGIVFKVDTSGKETVLYNFCSVAKCADGFYPETALIQDAAGNLYGTTTDGGVHHQYGTVFKVDTTGRETVLYSFPGRRSVGEVQPSGLVMDTAGNLYGTTLWGGAFHEGSVFEVTTSGKTRTLHSFTDGTDGGIPFGLVLDSAGNLYGTTLSGGNFNDCNGVGCGTLFELTP